MLITDEYRKLNEILHKQSPKYGVSGKRHAYIVESFIKKQNPKTILDYGCGKGTLSKSLSKYDVQEYDPCIPGKEKLPNASDLVYCGDVLEHIEMECLDNVLKHLLEITKQTVIFVISLKRGKRLFSNGTFVHRIVKDASWWIKKLSLYFVDFDLMDMKVSEKEMVVVFSK